MYLVLNCAERIVDISAEAQYVRRQENGVVIRCPEEKADAIYSANTDCFYPLEPTGYISDGHSLIEVKEVPEEVTAGYYFYHAGEFSITDEDKAALEKAKNAESLAAENIRLKEQVTSLEEELVSTQLALCDVYELLEGGGANA